MKDLQDGLGTESAGPFPTTLDHANLVVTGLCRTTDLLMGCGGQAFSGLYRTAQFLLDYTRLHSYSRAKQV
jgi:hypothetical protein